MIEDIKGVLAELGIPSDSVPWLWGLLSEKKENEFDRESILSLIKKIDQLHLQPEYYLAALICICHPIDAPHLDNIRNQIPPQVLNKYKTLVRICNLQLNLQNLQQVELSLKMLFAIVSDLQLLSLLLAIRLQRMENLAKKEESLQKTFAEQTLAMFAPLANRLGIFWIKAELEDHSLRYVNPAIYYAMKKIISKKRGERSLLVEELSKEIESLISKTKISHKVYGRYKRFYSTYKKLKKNNYDIDRIQDLIAFRILVDSVEECYTALSCIHSHWNPKPGRFKDYIAKPKVNGYQSLHTTVLTDKGEVIEIQIRTHEMHTVAEFGVAAHWLYKEQKQFNKGHEAYTGVLKNVTKMVSGETIQQELSLDFHQYIYVQTPNNDIIELPCGATPIDFAYSIHTDIGHHTTGAKLNGKIVKLDSKLKSGDRIEVITSPKQTPNKEWLNFAKTSKARNKIRREVNLTQREINRKNGWNLLEKEFKSHDLNLNRMVKEGRLDELSKLHRKQTFEHILASLGDGSTRASELLEWVLPSKSIKNEPSLEANNKITTPPTAPQSFYKSMIIVDGVDNVAIRFAKCCAPKPGDPIIGYITQGRGITIHHEDCSQLSEMTKARQISTSWNLNPNQSQKSEYPQLINNL